MVISKLLYHITHYSQPLDKYGIEIYLNLKILMCLDSL